MFPKKPFQKEKIQMQRRIKAYYPKTNPKKRKNVGGKDKGLPEKHFFRSAISFCIIYPTTGHRPEMKDYEIKEERVMEGFHSASLKIMKRKKVKERFTFRTIYRVPQPEDLAHLHLFNNGEEMKIQRRKEAKRTGKNTNQIY